jgi:hypothetical protein
MLNGAGTDATWQALRLALFCDNADSDECGQPFRLKAASISDRLRTPFR